VKKERKNLKQEKELLHALVLGIVPLEEEE